MSDVEKIESHIGKLKELVDRRDLALRLEKNRDFKKLILDEFCVSECAKYAQLSADPSLSAENRADALSLAQAAGHLRRWLSVIVKMGNQAESEIPGAQSELEDARREEQA